MKRINPLLTANNPVPIPGSRTRKGYGAQWCGYLDFTYQYTDSPCVMTTEVLDNRPGISLWEDKVLSTTDCQQGL
jgi:hypothetical protein